MLWWQAWNEFCCEQVACSELGGEEAQSELTGDQFWRERFLIRWIKGCDMMRCTEKNRFGVVKAGTVESMSNERCSVIDKTVYDVSESL